MSGIFPIHQLLIDSFLGSFLFPICSASTELILGEGESKIERDAHIQSPPYKIEQTTQNDRVNAVALNRKEQQYRSKPLNEIQKKIASSKGRISQIEASISKYKKELESTQAHINRMQMTPQEQDRASEQNTEFGKYKRLWQECGKAENAWAREQDKLERLREQRKQCQLNLSRTG